MDKLIICKGCGKEKKCKAKGFCGACYARQYESPLVVCINCGEEMPHAGKGMCRPCYRRDYYLRNSEDAKSYSRNYFKEHREQKRDYDYRYSREHSEKKKVCARRWYERNSEKASAVSRRWRERNPERVKILNRRWRRQNPERKAALEAHRKARKQNLPNTLTLEEIKHLLIIGKGTYPDEKLHLDHVVPISKGGGTTRANVHYIPAKVNLSKRDKLITEIYIQLPLGGQIEHRRTSSD